MTLKRNHISLVVMLMVMALSYQARGQEQVDLAPVRMQICAAQPVPPGWVMLASIYTSNCTTTNASSSTDHNAYIIQKLPDAAELPWHYLAWQTKLLRYSAKGLQMCEIRSDTLRCGDYLRIEQGVATQKDVPK